MGAKKIQISIDSGATWYTFPGNKGEYHVDGSTIDDTILGQTFKSEQSGMINFSITTNGLYKGFAGYVAKIKKSGVATTITDEPMSLVSGKTYVITASSKTVLDRTTPYTVKDNTVAVNPTNILSIDYLFGLVTFKPSYTPTGPITISGKYLPMTQVAKAQSFTLTQTAATIDTSDYETAQANGGYMTYDYGLRTVTLALKGVFAQSNGYEDLVTSRAECIVEINPDGNSNSVARGWFRPNSTSQSGNVGDLEDQDLNFSLTVPDQQDISLPFSWAFASGSTLNMGIRNAINSWQSVTTCKVNYLPDGATGRQGTAIVTECTLTGGLDAMNDFSLKFQGTGAPAAYP